MTVNVKIKNGIRYGSYDILGIKGVFPTQAITSTNLNHASFMQQPNFDFKTKFVEIVVRYPMRLFSDDDYRKRQIKKISQIIQRNPDKLCLLMVNGAKSLSITKERNLKLIQFQLECGFKLVKVFFKTSRQALENLKEYRKLIPIGSNLVPVLDENMDRTTFKSLYSNSYDHGDEIIGFLGREPKANNEDNLFNLQFIADRNGDSVIRLVSSIKKSMNGAVSSLSYHLYGFDAYSFITRFGNPNIPILELKALDQFSFKPLTNNSGLTCVVTKKNLFISANNLAKDNKSSVPISLHDIVRLNEILEDLAMNYTREQLEKIIKQKSD